MRAMRARSRRPMTVSVLMDARSVPISSGRQHGRFALLHAVLRAANGVRGVCRDHLAGNEPIEEHPDRGQVLLHGWFPVGTPEGGLPNFCDEEGSKDFRGLRNAS